jgi:hypothetical protein
VQQQVLGLQVAVHDVAVMQVLEHQLIDRLMIMKRLRMGMNRIMKENKRSGERM